MSIVAVTVMQELKELKGDKDKALTVPEGLTDFFEKEDMEELVEPCNICKHRLTIVDESTGTGFCFKCIHYWEKFKKE